MGFYDDPDDTIRAVVTLPPDQLALRVANDALQQAVIANETLEAFADRHDELREFDRARYLELSERLRQIEMRLGMLD